jgi:hypothetical protein
MQEIHRELEGLRRGLRDRGSDENSEEDEDVESLNEGSV